MKKSLIALSLIFAVSLTFAHDKVDKDKKASKKAKTECCSGKSCSKEAAANAKKEGKTCCDKTTKAS